MTLLKTHGNQWKKSRKPLTEQAAEAAESVEGAWSEVKDEFQEASAETWSEPEVPQTPVPPPTRTPIAGAHVVNEAADDPGRWNDNLYTPGVEEPAVETAKVVDYVATPPAQPEKKEKFPVWAIVLLVLLVLCICIACPIIILGGGIFAIFKDTVSILPTLFI